MSCYRPIRASRDDLSGEVRLGALPGWGRPLSLPCSVCVGCRLDRAREWSVRIEHERQLWDSNLFVTLTYERLGSRSLVYGDFQGFMKRLRRSAGGLVRGSAAVKAGPGPVRFFCAGEYGGETGRPHFHAILFNVAFRDSVRLRNETSRSAELERLWEKGSCVIGSVTPASAAYVAGYSLKKVGRGGRPPVFLDEETGELEELVPEFVHMSRRPGIGYPWFERFAGDLFPADRAVSGGRVCKVPTYYWDKFRFALEGQMCSRRDRFAHRVKVDALEIARFERARERASDSTPERLAVREEVVLRHRSLFHQRGL